MHPLLTIASVGAGLFAGARLARRALERSAAKRQQDEFAQRGDDAKPVGDLRPDPNSGVYKPKKR